MDDVDLANELADARVIASLNKLKSVHIPVGQPGECKECGDHSPRLVGGRCAPCRDGR